MTYAAVLSVVQVLEQITRQDYFYDLFTIKQQIKTLHEKFCILQSFLENDPPKDEEAIDHLEMRIREVAYQAEDTVEFHVLDQISHEKEYFVPGRVKRGSWRKIFAVQKVMSLWNKHEENTVLCAVEKLYQDVQRVVDEVDSIVKKAKKIMESQKIEDLQISNFTADAGSPRMAPGGTTDIVGFDDDVMKIKEKLSRESSELQIIPIVGMGGIGKTALAKNVFYDPLIASHFDIRAWTTITQDHKLPDIVLGLLHSITTMSENLSSITAMSKNFSPAMEGQERLYKTLKGRRYLIVLDDIWKIEAWDDVKMLLPDDNNGSRIILTTRIVDVANYANFFGPYHLMQFLNEEQSWNLLHDRVFAAEPCPPELEETGRLIAKNCRGLPLSIILVAGLLFKMSKIKYQWENIARDVSLAVTESDEELSSKILSLSYNHLPRHLIPCFLYMAGFPEDYEIPVFKLISLWVAEGFLKPMGSKSLEEAGEVYLEDLVKRSLVLVTKKRSNGKFRFCSMHDLLRDLCIKKARDEKFIHPMNGIQERMENKRRLSFSKSVEWFHFKYANTTNSPVRSIFCCSYNDRVLIVSLLKVLYILEVNFESFPVEILQLSRLKFLAFSSGTIRYCTLPPSMPKHQNLQTLIVSSSVKFKTSEHMLVANLPIWRMPQLRHLVFLNINLSPAPFCCFSDDDSPVLENLQTLSRVKNFRFTIEAIEMVPNLKKLKAVYTGDSHKQSSEYELHNLVHLNRLETLNLNFQPSWLKVSIPVRFGVPLKLKKLTLRGCGLSWKDMTSIGSLPNLEVLKLLVKSVMDKEWESVEGEFPRLKFLLMDMLELKLWVAEDMHFPSLERLIIRRCSELENIPSGIGDIPTLQVIEVDNSKSAAAESARQILEEQRDMGNDGLQVRIGPHRQRNFAHLFHASC